MSYDIAEHGNVWVLENFAAYPGLVVRVRQPGFSAYRMLLRADAVLEDRAASAVKRLDALNGVFTALADSIESWTLTRNGRPVPLTRAAVLACDGQLLAAVTAAWRRHVLVPNAAPRPAEAPAPAFDDRVLRDLPMEALTDPVDEPAVEDAPELAVASA